MVFASASATPSVSSGSKCPYTSNVIAMYDQLPSDQNYYVRTIIEAVVKANSPWLIQLCNGRKFLYLNNLRQICILRNPF